MATGGALWFTDLTVPDPLFILPVITCTSMFLLFEFGMEGSVDPRQGMAPIGRYLMRSLPFVMFLFVHNFPAATLLFWSTSNLFTLSYAMLLKNSWIKKKLNIPARLKHDPASLPLSNVSFKDQFKDAMEKGKVKRTSMDVRRLDDIAFRKAGVGPLRKTYKEPPEGA
jgi:YidC/Oxa1 family membrane protein insertase